MLRCLIDVSIPEDDKCSKCCFTVMKKIVTNADVLALKNGKRKKKLKIIVQNVVNENRI